MKIINCVQGTQEWLDVRCGVPTASNFDKIVTSKGEPSKQRVKYLYQLAGESILGHAEPSYKNEIMQRGNELECQARQCYSLIADQEIEQVGFCLADGGLYGCSPDGFINKNGIIEIKCPILSTHVKYLYDNVFPSDYFQQVQGQLLVTGREYAIFFSYYPGFKPFIKKVYPDNSFISKLKKELGIFNADLISIIGKVNNN